MQFYSKVTKYERLPDAMKQFGNPEDGTAEEFPVPQMKITLENGVEFVLVEQGESPRWSFTTKVRTDPATPVPSCLGASYHVNDKFVRRGNDGIYYDVTKESLESVEFSGFQEDYQAFMDVLYEGIENSV